ncbi:MAG: hypothetical protein Q8Q17_01060 [bacterium]|nr:hypothetical protein [bacterium]
MQKLLKPTKAEKEFLTLAYNRFYDIFEEIIADSFWGKDEWHRFSQIKDIFSVYAELLNYEPIKLVVDWMKKGGRPPMEGEIGSDLFKFIRNMILHFPFFDSWNSVWISRSIINWNKTDQSIDKFLKKYTNHKEVKYRFWESDKKKMTYLSIKFPTQYSKTSKIFLKDIISEKDGIKFSIILMKKILDTQVEKINQKK